MNMAPVITVTASGQRRRHVMGSATATDQAICSHHDGGGPSGNAPELFNKTV